MYGSHRNGLDGACLQAFRLAGYEFSVSSDCPEIVDRVGRLFAGCRTARVGSSADAYEFRPSRGSDGANVELILRDRRVARGPLEAAIDRLIWDTSTRAFESGHYLYVHAGVASWGGQGVMLPAPPDHGKSTTVAALVRAGFDFLSDEAAALDLTDGTVHPFPRPVSLSSASLEALEGSGRGIPDPTDPHTDEEHRMAPDDLRPGALGIACRARFIVAPSYRADDRTRLEPVDRTEMLRLLVEQTFNLTTFGGDGFRLLGDVVRGAECYRLTIADLPTAVHAIRGLFEKAGT
ncbi:MAG: hypothetical protein ACRDH7_04855 [Actinomycetota bacterium]